MLLVLVLLLLLVLLVLLLVLPVLLPLAAPAAPANTSPPPRPSPPQTEWSVRYLVEPDSGIMYFCRFSYEGKSSRSGVRVEVAEVRCAALPAGASCCCILLCLLLVTPAADLPSLTRSSVHWRRGGHGGVAGRQLGQGAGCCCCCWLLLVVVVMLLVLVLVLVLVLLLPPPPPLPPPPLPRPPPLPQLTNMLSRRPRRAPTRTTAGRSRCTGSRAPSASRRCALIPPSR